MRFSVVSRMRVDIIVEVVSVRLCIVLYVFIVVFF